LWAIWPTVGNGAGIAKFARLCDEKAWRSSHHGVGDPARFRAAKLRNHATKES
jgi:hypothetical protein